MRGQEPIAPRTVESTPYPWPYDACIDPDALALLVCGAGAVWSSRTPTDPIRSAAITRLRNRIAEIGALTVLLRHDAPDGRPVHDLPHPAAPALEPWATDQVVVASGIDGFHGSRLDDLLRATGRTHLLLVGHGFETTIHSTLRRANDIGYECLVAHDACLPIDVSLVPAAISQIEMSGGIFGAVATTEAILAALPEPDPAAPPIHPPSHPPATEPHEESL